MEVSIKIVKQCEREGYKEYFLQYAQKHTNVVKYTGKNYIKVPYNKNDMV